MFTLSDKQRIINSASDFLVRDAAGAVVTTQAAMAITDTLEIEGFAKIPVSDIVDIKLHRGRVAVAESKDFTVVAPAGIAVGDSVEVILNLKSERYAGEIQNDYIGGSAPIVFSTAPLGAITAAAIRTAIVTAFTNFAAQHFSAIFPVSVVSGTAATSIRTVAATGYEFVTMESVQIRRSQQGIPSQTKVSLAVAAVNAVGTQGLGTGKYLEESVRMANWANTNPYGVDTVGVGADLRGLYTEAYITISAPYYENISTLAAGHGPLPATASFTIWFNEATMLGANGVISLLAEAAIDVASAVATVSTSANTAPLTSAQENAEALIIANGDSVATAALFIA